MSAMFSEFILLSRPVTFPQKVFPSLSTQPIRLGGLGSILLSDDTIVPSPSIIIVIRTSLATLARLDLVRSDSTIVLGCISQTVNFRPPHTQIKP